MGIRKGPTLCCEVVALSRLQRLLLLKRLNSFPNKTSVGCERLTLNEENFPLQLLIWYHQKSSGFNLSYLYLFVKKKKKKTQRLKWQKKNKTSH